MNILEEVEGCRTIGISGHVRPDGDCVGSCMAMALYLQKCLPQARVDVFLGKFSQALEQNIAGTEQIRHDYMTDVKVYDAFICLDCEKERLGEALPMFDAAKKTINIDHHQSNPGSGMVNYIVPAASSACELVFDVLEQDRIDEPIARNLYIGMVTDTGVFQYSSTSRKTMETAGRLLEYGFDAPRIIREVFYEKTYIQQQILGRALLESILFLHGKCIFSRIDRKTMQFFQATSSDLDGIVSQLADTHGVVCAIFMYELEPLIYKVSLRSNCDEVDVAEIAEKFGGGGHKRAAGCTVNAPYHDIINNMSGILEKQMQNAGLIEKS